jgi:hypothetical protein
MARMFSGVPARAPHLLRDVDIDLGDTSTVIEASAAGASRRRPQKQFGLRLRWLLD